MRNVPLGVVRQAVKAETQKSMQSTSTVQDAEINQVIYDVQDWLSAEYDWPFLQDRWDVICPAVSRFIPFANLVNDQGIMGGNLNFERAGDLKTYVKWNQVWQEVPYGIREMEEFNYIDSDRNMVLDPIQRWEFDDQTDFEIWPIPATSQTMRFVGQRVVTELRSSLTPPVTWNDSATLDLDDLTVKYFAASEYMTRKEQPQIAQLLLTKANKRLMQIRRTYPTIKRPFIVGGASTFDRRALRVVPMVVVAGAK
jgi:hypothetical protein